VASFLLAEHARSAAGGAPLHVFEVLMPAGAAAPVPAACTCMTG